MGVGLACCLFLFLLDTANGFSELHCSLQEQYLHGKYELNKTILNLQSIYPIFLFFLLFAIVEFRISAKTPLIKGIKQKDQVNNRLVL